MLAGLLLNRLGETLLRSAFELALNDLNLGVKVFDKKDILHLLQVLVLDEVQHRLLATEAV